MKEITNVYDYVSLKLMRYISTIDISPDQKPFKQVHKWRMGASVPIDMEDYERVTSILREVERKIFNRMVSAGNAVLGRFAIPIQYDDYPDTKVNTLGQTERFNRLDAAYNELFYAAMPHNLLSELGLACRDHYAPNVYNSLFLLYTLYAEPAAEYIRVMSNIGLISELNTDISRCRGAITKCERVDVTIRGGEVVGILLYAHKRNERVPARCLELATHDLQKSDLRWLMKIKDADIRFSLGDDFAAAKAWLHTTLDRPDSIMGTKDKNNYEVKFFRKITALYRYIMDTKIFDDAKLLPTAATIDFILNLLKIPDNPNTRKKLYSYIGRNPQQIAF